MGNDNNFLEASNDYTHVGRQFRQTVDEDDYQNCLRIMNETLSNIMSETSFYQNIEVGAACTVYTLARFSNKLLGESTYSLGSTENRNKRIMEDMLYAADRSQEFQQVYQKFERLFQTELSIEVKLAVLLNQLAHLMKRYV